MKIALLHDSILPARNYGGIERVVMALAREYTQLGHQVVIACRKGSELREYESIALPENHKELDARVFLPADTEFLHSHEPRAIKPTLPFLVTIHGNGHPGERYFKNTNFLSESHCRNHGGRHFVYNGVDPADYPLVDKKDDYFVFLARARWRVKNLRACIAFARDLGVRLEVIGGDGRSDRNVRYHGLIGEGEGKIEILSRARALLYPTNWEEPFGLAAVEALACGTPVVASMNGAMPEVVRPGTGFLCATYDEFLEAGRRVGEIKPTDCRDSVTANFTTARMANGYLELMRRILDHGELDQSPQYAFDPARVKLIYKPTLLNRLSLAVLGKV